MDLNKFALSRDLLYIAGLTTGIALGLFLTLIRRDLDKKSRNRRITLALLFLSVTIAAFALSFIFSFGGIVKHKAVLALGGICVALCIPAVYFPRTVAYPLILLGGLAVSWLGFSCLRFPELGASPALILSHPGNTGSGDSYLIRFIPDTRTAAASAGLIQIDGERVFLHCTTALIETEPHFPFVGGRKHGFISAVSSDAGSDYSVPFMNRGLMRFLFTRGDSLTPLIGMNFREFSTTIIPDNAVPEIVIPVYIDSRR
jgi:hypothetical protein